MCVQCGTCVKNCPAGALSFDADGKVAFDPAKCVQCDTCIHVCPNDSSPRTCEMTPEEVYAKVKKQIPFIRGISVSGGECMLHPDFLTELFRLAKQDGLGTLIDSNGTISFESKEGTGTTFVIRIPFQIDADMKDRTETEEKTEASIQGLHVLLAEDNELNMEIAEFVLQNEGTVVTKAWNGQEAVDIFRKSRPGEFDVILMDIMMPVMNGYEAAKMIRSLDREDAKVIPIIAMTANAFTEDKMRAKEAGMDEHIAKPVDGKLLVKVINELVKRNQREKL